jgi:hypothetical protein
MTDRDTIDDETLAQRVACGAIVDAEAVGRPGGWTLIVRDGPAQRLVTGRHGAARLFVRMETLARYLKRLGVDHFHVDATGFAAKSLPGLAGDVADHDRWFRDQVGDTLRGVEHGNVRILTDDEHRARWQQKREEMLSRLRRSQ